MDGGGMQVCSCLGEPARFHTEILNASHREHRAHREFGDFTRFPASPKKVHQSLVSSLLFFSVISVFSVAKGFFKVRG
jgi:hypothetical protein